MVCLSANVQHLSYCAGSCPEGQKNNTQNLTVAMVISLAELPTRHLRATGSQFVQMGWSV